VVSSYGAMRNIALYAPIVSGTIANGTGTIRSHISTLDISSLVLS